MSELDRESPSTTTGESPFAPPSIPPLSIAHLMLWMFCSSVHLAGTRALHALQQQQELGESFAFVRDASGVIYGVVVGAAFAGAIVLTRASLRGGTTIARHPGHWLLLVTAVTALVRYPFTVLSLVIMIFRDEWTSQPSVVLLLLFGALELLPAVGYILAVKFTGEIRWRVFFSGLVATSAAQVAMQVVAVVPQLQSSFVRLLWVYNLLSYAAAGLAAFAVVAAIIDVSRRESRDWLHWVGVAVYVLSISISWLFMLGMWLTR